MKKYNYAFLLIGLLLVSSQVFAQNKVTIKGEIAGYNPEAIIYFIYADVVKQQQNVDSVKLIDGKFDNSISISEPTQMGMIMSPDGKALNSFSSKEQEVAEAIAFYIDEGEFNLKFDGSFKNFKFDPPNKIVPDFKAYNAIINKDRKLILDSINRHYAEDGEVGDDGTIRISPDKVDEYQAVAALAANGLMNELHEFAISNTDSYIGLLALGNLYQQNPSASTELLTILNGYSKKNQNTRRGTELRKMLELAIKTGM